MAKFEYLCAVYMPTRQSYFVHDSQLWGNLLAREKFSKVCRKNPPTVNAVAWLSPLWTRWDKVCCDLCPSYWRSRSCNWLDDANYTNEKRRNQLVSTKTCMEEENSDAKWFTRSTQTTRLETTCWAPKFVTKTKREKLKHWHEAIKSFNVSKDKFQSLPIQSFCYAPKSHLRQD